jgi:hypothetical protein
MMNLFELRQSNPRGLGSNDILLSALSISILQYFHCFPSFMAASSLDLVSRTLTQIDDPLDKSEVSDWRSVLSANLEINIHTVKAHVAHT